MASLFYRKRIKLDKGLYLNFGHSKSNGLGFSLSSRSTNTKGLGWNFNSKNGLSLALRGTGLRWTFGSKAKKTTLSKQTEVSKTRKTQQEARLKAQKAKEEEQLAKIEAKKARESQPFIAKLEEVSHQITQLIDYQVNSSILSFETQGIGRVLNEIRDEMYKKRTYYNVEYTLYSTMNDDFNAVQEYFGELLIIIILKAIKNKFNELIESLYNEGNIYKLSETLNFTNEFLSDKDYREVDFGQYNNHMNAFTTWISDKQIGSINSTYKEFKNIFVIGIGENLLRIQEIILQKIDSSTNIDDNLESSKILVLLVKILNNFTRQGWFGNIKKEDALNDHNNMIYIRCKIFDDLITDFSDIVENQNMYDSTIALNYLMKCNQLVQNVNSKDFIKFHKHSDIELESLAKYTESYNTLLIDYTSNFQEYWENFANENFHDINDLSDKVINYYYFVDYIAQYNRSNIKDAEFKSSIELHKNELLEKTQKYILKICDTDELKKFDNLFSKKDKIKRIFYSGIIFIVCCFLSFANTSNTLNITVVVVGFLITLAYYFLSKPHIDEFLDKVKEQSHSFKENGNYNTYYNLLFITSKSPIKMYKFYIVQPKLIENIKNHIASYAKK